MQEHSLCPLVPFLRVFVLLRIYNIDAFDKRLYPNYEDPENPGLTLPTDSIGGQGT